VRYAYQPSDRGVSVPVSLSVSTETVKLFAKVDTGADHCVFERGFAEALLIDVEGGTPLNFSTVAGEFRAYGHELTLAVFGIEVHALVYFYENPNITRNVLGRNSWLNRVRLGLVDHDSVVYLSPYDE
jgi:predicted aspartyl protease